MDALENSTSTLVLGKLDTVGNVGNEVFPSNGIGNALTCCFPMVSNVKADICGNEAVKSVAAQTNPTLSRGALEAVESL